MSRTALYRFYDADGDLLYVGVSVTPWSRWKQHKGQKDWAEEVATTAVEWHDSRPEALAAEKAAIIAEEPRYNVQHSVIRQESAAPVPALYVGAVCTVCGRVIQGGGSVQIDLDWVNAAEQAIAERDGLWSPADLMAVEFPEWEVLHYDCEPDPERELYVIPLSDLRHLGSLLRWTAHLMDKPWVSVTNWSSILHNIVSGDGTGPLFIPRDYL